MTTDRDDVFAPPPDFTGRGRVTGPAGKPPKRSVTPPGSPLGGIGKGKAGKARRPSKQVLGSTIAPPPPGKNSQRARQGLRATLSGLSWTGKLLVAIGLGIALAIGLRLTVIETFEVPSSSMAPTLEPGDRLMVEKLSYVLGEPRRGDIVVFLGTGTWDTEPPAEKYYVKRVVAVGGDKVRCCYKGRVTVNGVPVHEAHLHGRNARFASVKVPKGHLFVMGDNREYSEDSRVRGPIPADTVVGKAVLTVWPVGRAGLLD